MKPEKNGWYSMGRPNEPKEIVYVFFHPERKSLVYQRVGDSHLYRVEDTFDMDWHGSIIP